MGKNKLQKLKEIEGFENVIQEQDFPPDQDVPLKGSWSRQYFKNNHPLILELACGKGDYTIALAKRYPQKNFIGIDVKGARLWRGGKTALEEKIGNAAFLRIHIKDIERYFAQDEASELWITFPDPYPKDRHEKHRLLAPEFLKAYKTILKKDGVVHFKTDADKLFEYALETLPREGCKILEVVEDVYKQRPEDELLTIKTHYERQHLLAGKIIKYLKFRF